MVKYFIDTAVASHQTQAACTYAAAKSQEVAAAHAFATWLSSQMGVLSAGCVWWGERERGGGERGWAGVAACKCCK